MQIFNKKYTGIFVATFYLLILRLIYNSKAFEYSFLHTNLFSISFIWLLPFVIGALSILFMRKESNILVVYAILAPVSAVLLFFLIALLIRIENLVSLLIISIPFLAGSIAGGLTAKFITLNKRKSFLLPLLLLPFIGSILESRFTSPDAFYTVKTAVIMNTSPDKIWPHVIRVEDISEADFCKGLFNYSGVPRPLYAELDRDTIGATRRGHFDGGLIFEELVSVWQRNKKIQMYIKTDDKEIGSSVFNEHVLKGGVFTFINASYELEQIDAHKTKIILSSVYKMKSKMNNYASFWGHSLLADFQNRLLTVIKKRCDNL